MDRYKHSSIHWFFDEPISLQPPPATCKAFHMTTPIRWGILGTGNIAKQFAKGLAVLPDAQLAAVGSRSHESAQSFASEFKAARSHGSYEALARDPDIDVIYIATPHPLHCANTLLCLKHDKPVLCEKPFAVNAVEAQAMITAARSKKLFLMEAMWTRFLPVTTQVMEWIRAGRIGEPRQVLADFGYRCGWNPQSRLLDRSLGGGALLDVGVYCLAYARMVFGSAPERLHADAHVGETGVDEQLAIIARHPNGGLASITAAIRTNTPHELWICGTSGRIKIPGFWHAREATLFADGAEPETAKPEFPGNGYQHQAAEVARCLRAGLSESPRMPLNETLEIASTMDQVRRLIGLSYPSDTSSSSTPSLTAKG